jgi:hypothetical protein
MTALPVQELCPLCSTPLREEQDWCLRCGAAARTRLAAPAKWRAPVLIAGVLIVLSLAVLGAALVKLSEKKSAGATRTRSPASFTNPASATPLPTQTTTTPTNTTTPLPSSQSTTPIVPPGSSSRTGSGGAKSTPEAPSGGVLGRPNGALTAKP